ncbi:MAG: PKD domain-containing protein, partial [Bacteroidota bacterium]
MQKIYKRIVIIFFFVCFYCSSNATHIVGGELYYKWLSNNRYAIELRVYRDCYTGVPPFDNPASIGVFNANNSFVMERCVALFFDSLIPPTITTPCFNAPVDVCYERGIYRDTITLPPIQGGYQIAYQRCCRNQSILNIVSPLDVGITIYAHTPTDPVNALDGNPVITNLPPTFICIGLPFVWDHSAIDPDGDSLSYELCLPFEGGEGQFNNSCPTNQNDPGCGNGFWICGPAPHPPFSPPYTNVTWQSPFSIANLLGGVPMTIDPVTGILTATPNTVGQFVYAICVNQFRNGILIGKTRRDFQVNVVPCPSLVVAALQNPIIICGDSSVFFQNLSTGASFYNWFFGDPTTLSDTSHLINPTYNYPDTGAYTVTLIAISAFDSTCTDTAVGIVHIYPPFNADFSYTDSLCSYKIFFTDTSSNNGSGVTSGWNWRFGDATTSAIHNPSHNYSGPGNYTVTFITTSSFGCKDTVTKVVTVDSLPSATISVQPISCHGDSNATATANPKGGTIPYTFLWSNGQTTQTIINLIAGTYTVTLTDSNNCVAVKTIIINQPTVLASALKSTDAYCEGKCIGTATATPSGGTPPYSYSWNDPSNQITPVAYNLCPGKYKVLMTDNNGCTKTDSVIINYSDYIPPLYATVSNDTLYEGQSAILGSTIYSNTTYTWTPPVFLTNPNIPGPSVTINTAGTYIYVIEISDTLGCRNSDSIRIVVRSTNCVEP